MSRWLLLFALALSPQAQAGARVAGDYVTDTLPVNATLPLRVNGAASSTIGSGITLSCPSCASGGSISLQGAYNGGNTINEPQYNGPGVYIFGSPSPSPSPSPGAYINTFMFKAESTVTEPNSLDNVRFGVYLSGDVDCTALSAGSHACFLSGGFDDGTTPGVDRTNHNYWDNGFIVRPPPTARAGAIGGTQPAGDFFGRASDGLSTGQVGGIFRGMGGLPGPGGGGGPSFQAGTAAGPCLYSGQCAQAGISIDLHKAYLQTSNPTGLLGYGGDGAGLGNIVFNDYSGGGQLQLNNASMFFVSGANTVLNMTNGVMNYTSFGADSVAPAETHKTNSTWTAQRLSEWYSGSTLRARIMSSPTSTGNGFEVYGNTGSAAQNGTITAIAVAGDGGFAGASLALDATPVSGKKFILGTGNNSNGLANVGCLYESSSYLGLCVDATGDISPRTNTAAQDLGTSSLPWRDGYHTGKFKLVNNETTDGTGVPYIEKKGQDVASAGGGAQNTTIATFTISTTGTYRLQSMVDCTTADASVTVQASWTDNVNSTAQSTNVISATACAANGWINSTPILIRPSAATAVLVKFTLSSQATTKGTATLERLN